MVNNTLISYFPLPNMPFQTHTNVVFENGRGEEPLKKKAKKLSPAEIVQKIEMNKPYAYGPDYTKLRQPTGQIVNFVIA